MTILIKMVVAILLGLAMISTVLLAIAAAAAFIGFIARLIGFNILADAASEIHKAMWSRTKKWFMFYKK